MAFKQVRLGEYFKFEKGLGYKGEFLAEKSNVGLVGIDSQVPGGGYKENSEKPYSGPYKPQQVVDVGDVIVAATDITQDGSVLGSTLMIPESTNYETLIYSGDVMKAIPLKPDEFSLEYFYNLYRVEKYRAKVAYGDTGTTVRRLSEDGICEQFVPLPDLPTQIAINEIISLIDQQIANNKGLSRNLEVLAQSVFKSWFIDFDPVHTKKKGENPFGMDAETAKLFSDSFVKSEMGDIPKGWHISNLKDECDIKQGRYLAPNQMEQLQNEESPVPVIGGNGILGFTHKSTFTFAVPLITCRGSKCGLLQWGEFPSWVSNNAMAVTFKHGAQNNFFLLLLFKTLNFDEVTTGSAQPQITITNLGLLEFIMPPVSIIDKFIGIVSHLRNIQDSIKISTSSLEDLLETLLPGLIDNQLVLPSELIAS
jgi:type I restriction enzyme S subunit